MRCSVTYITGAEWIGLFFPFFQFFDTKKRDRVHPNSATMMLITDFFADIFLAKDMCLASAFALVYAYAYALLLNIIS